MIDRPASEQAESGRAPDDPRRPGRTPRTAAGRAFAGWMPPRLRASSSESVAAIEIEAARDALTDLRNRIVDLGAAPGGADVTTTLAVLDAAIAELATSRTD